MDEKEVTLVAKFITQRLALNDRDLNKVKQQVREDFKELEKDARLPN